MANLTFSDLVSECMAHLGLDSTDATNQANVYRWINYVQQDFCSRWPWPFMLGREAVATVPDYSTGTVDISNLGTTVTGHSTAFTSTHGDGTYFIQFLGTNDFYRVSARSSATSLTIETAFQGSALSSVTYILRKFFYSLSSSADEVIDVRNLNTPIKLIQADLRSIDTINPLVQSTSPGYAYMMSGVDSSGNNVFMPYPFPNDARLFEFRTKKRPVDMVVTTTETPSVPNKYAHLLAWGAIAIGFAYLRKLEDASAWNSKFENRVAMIKKEYRQSEDNQPILQSIDSVSRSRWIQFPSSYPVVNG